MILESAQKNTPTSNLCLDPWEISFLELQHFQPCYLWAMDRRSSTGARHHDTAANDKLQRLVDGHIQVVRLALRNHHRFDRERAGDVGSITVTHGSFAAVFTSETASPITNPTLHSPGRGYSIATTCL